VATAHQKVKKCYATVAIETIAVGGAAPVRERLPGVEMQNYGDVVGSHCGRNSQVGQSGVAHGKTVSVLDHLG